MGIQFCYQADDYVYNVKTLVGIKKQSLPLNKKFNLNQLEQISGQQIVGYQKWSFVFFSLMTFISILNGKTTPFYIIYFFWCHELIHLLVDKLFYKKNANAILISDSKDFSALGLMGIYWIFIVVIFGLIANFDNTQVVLINLEVLFLQNWFFNINLIGVAAGRIYLHLSKKHLEVNPGSISPNMIVLHVSIIFGAFILFFIVRKFPTTFTPDNFWGSILIVTPFMLLKMLVDHLSAPITEK